MLTTGAGGVHERPICEYNQLMTGRARRRPFFAALLRRGAALARARGRSARAVIVGCDAVVRSAQRLGRGAHTARVVLHSGRQGFGAARRNFGRFAGSRSNLLRSLCFLRTKKAINKADGRLFLISY